MNYYKNPQQKVKNSAQLLDQYEGKRSNEYNYNTRSSNQQPQTLNNNMFDQHYNQNEEFEIDNSQQQEQQTERYKNKPSNNYYEDNQRKSYSPPKQQQTQHKNSSYKSNNNDYEYLSPNKTKDLQAKQKKYYYPEKTKDNSCDINGNAENRFSEKEEEFVKRSKPNQHNIRMTDDHNRYSVRNQNSRQQQYMQETIPNKQLQEINENKIKEFCQKYIKYDEFEYRENVKQYHLANSELYEGEVEGSALNGKGIYRFKNGDIYIGDWLNNKFNGYGMYIFENGENYEGQFVDNYKEGIGKYTYCNESYYEGYWENNQKHGEGKYYKQSNQYSYLGQFINGHLEQFGIIQDVNEKIVFKGLFCRGQPQFHS